MINMVRSPQTPQERALLLSLEILGSLDAHRPGNFVRMAPNEVSVSHPDAVKALLLTTLPKVGKLSDRI